MAPIYDVAVIGGGIIGAAAVYRLLRKNLKVVLLEKRNDVGNGVSKANSGIIHGGFHYSAVDTLKGRLELRGNQLYTQWHRELGFPFQRCGIIVAAYTAEQQEKVQALYRRGAANGVPGIELADAARLRELEPKLAPGVAGGLYAPRGGVVEPYAVVFALIRAAKANGLTLKTNFQVTAAERRENCWEIRDAAGESVRARYAVNAAGLCADEVSEIFGGEKFRILPRKGEEYLLDRRSAARPSRIIFPVPSEHSKGVLVIPTAGGTTMIGPTAQIVEDKEDTATTEVNRKEIFALAKKMVTGISERDLITAFSGSRPVMEGHEDFFIAPSAMVPGLIQAAGIQSPGLTAAPAIAELIEKLLQKAGLAMSGTAEFRLPEPYRQIRDADPDTAGRMHDEDPAWTNIVCRCEKVSEAEIRQAVRDGHVTVDAVKLATRAGMGRCQGGFCTLKIMELIADECGIALETVLKQENGSRISAGKAD